MLDSSATDARPQNAPDDHPKVQRGKTGILLANLGTPDDSTLR